jgi:MFS transporter, DHA2 family, multidrug resistance protein
MTTNPVAAMSEKTKLLVFAVMALGMFMSLLDVQIVAASLPEIESGLSAGADEGSWVQTSYLIAEIVMIPLSAFLSRAFSTRWVFTVSAAAFTVSSIACGFAWNLNVMIACRAVQGFVGGAMVPTVFATGFVLFQGKKQALIPAILGIVATLAPTLGPTLGGWITDVLSWHWLFFINIVPGLLITILVPIYAHVDEADPSVLRGFDPWGIPLLAMFLGGLEYVLEEGPRWDWFEDPTNCWVAAASATSALFFFYNSFTHPRPVVDLRIFRNTRFAMGCLFQFVLGIGVFSSIYLIPQYLASVQDYRSLDIGKAVFITGIAQVLATPFAAGLSRRMDPRHMILFGFLLFALSLYSISYLNSQWGKDELFWPQAMRGFAMMFCIVPATNMALGAMPPQWLKSASGLSNLMRNLGGAIGIAASNTVINHRFHLHYTRIVETVTSANPNVDPVLGGLARQMQVLTSDTAEQQQMAMSVLNQLVSKEALSMTYADSFLVLASLFLLALTVLPFSRRMRPTAASSADSH